MRFTRWAASIAAICDDSETAICQPPMNDKGLFNQQGYYADGLRDGALRRRLFTDQPPGLHISRRSLPPGLVVVEDYLPEELGRTLLTHARAQPGKPSTVQAPEAAAGETITRLSAARVTDYIDIDGVADGVHAVMRDIFLRQVGPHYGKSVAWYEKPELLRYRPGGHYSPHADAENWDAGSRTWSRAIDRDFSILLYLNDGYRGGSLAFPNFGLRLSPSAGMLVIFPSDHRYVHCAEPVEEGERIVLVCWGAASGSKRVGKGAPPGATILAAPD